MTTRKKPKKTRWLKKPTEREMLCRFVSLPKVYRQEEFGYKNLTDFAKKYKVNPGTISDWLKEDEIKEKIRENWKVWGRDKTPDVLISLYRTAIREGKASEVKAWMQIVEDIKEEMPSTERPVKIELIVRKSIEKVYGKD